MEVYYEHIVLFLCGKVLGVFVYFTHINCYVFLYKAFVSGEAVFSEVFWLVFECSDPEVFVSSGLSSSAFLALASVLSYLSVAVGS